MRTYIVRSSFVVMLNLVAIANIAAAQSLSETKQYGAKRLDFSVGEFDGFVVLPANDVLGESKPWVWYAPTFIGRYPNDALEWMARQLLDAGFAIAGIDVGESYGSPLGVRAYNDFYDHVVREFGLNPEACLLCQSRGGLMLLNWAIEFPDRVQCIAGIYSVCNLESYPGLDRACSAYGMTKDELRANLKSHNPIDRLKPLVDAAIPLLFIHGDSDTVVPIEDNAGKLIERIRMLNGHANLIVVPGKGHAEIAEFFQSEPLIAFLLHRGNPLDKSPTDGEAKILSDAVTADAKQ